MYAKRVAEGCLVSMNEERMTPSWDGAKTKEEKDVECIYVPMIGMMQKM